jgi:HEAT repeat protein
MSTSMPQKPSVPKTTPSAAAPPAKTEKMFGVSISVEKQQQVVEKQPMSAKRKRLIIAGALLLVSVLILWFQYGPSTSADPEAVDHPAVKEVKALAAKKDVSGLTQYMKNDDVVAAKRAVTALAELSGVDAISDALNDPRPEVRTAAVSELANRGDLSSLPVLSKYLQDQDPGVRITAVRGMASLRQRLNADRP